jgi:hypothetical protein
MACRGLRSSASIFFVIFCGASVFLFSWLSGRAFGQESDSKTTHSSPRERDGDRPYLRDRLDWNWNQRGRTVPRGESAAGLRFRAYQQRGCGFGHTNRRWRCGQSARRTHPSGAWMGHPHSLLRRPLHTHPLFSWALQCGPRWGQLRWLPMLQEMERRITTGSRGGLRR